MADAADRENKGNIKPSPTKYTVGVKRCWKETQDEKIMPVGSRKKFKALPTAIVEGVRVYSQEDLRNVGLTAKTGLDFVKAKGDSDISYNRLNDDENVNCVQALSQSSVVQKWRTLDMPHIKMIEAAHSASWSSNECSVGVCGSLTKSATKSHNLLKKVSNVNSSDSDSPAKTTDKFKPFSIHAPMPVKFSSDRTMPTADLISQVSRSPESKVESYTVKSNSLVDYDTHSDSSSSNYGSPKSNSFVSDHSNLSTSRDSDSTASHPDQVVSNSWINVASKWTDMDEPNLTYLSQSGENTVHSSPHFKIDTTGQFTSSPQPTPAIPVTAHSYWVHSSPFTTPPTPTFISPTSPCFFGASPENSAANWTWPHIGLRNTIYPNRSLILSTSRLPPPPLLPHHSSFSEGFRRPPRELFSSVTSSSETSSSPSTNRRRYGHRFYLPPYDVDVLNFVDPSLTFIDTHCHLDFLFNRCNFKGSYSKYRNVNADTFHPNYEGCVAIFCDPQTFGQFTMWRNLLDEDKVWGAFGCHPHMAHSYDGNAEEYLKVALDNSKVIALGEIGLDYSAKNTTDHEMQKQVFKRQLRIALEKELPIVIHSRNSHLDTIQILKEEIPKNHKIHRHCFTGDWNEAQLWMNEFPNLYLGLTAVVTFPTAREVHEVARQIPLNRLLLETDAPYFLPRQAAKELRWSHPGMAIHVAAQVAALRFDANIEDVLKATRANTKAMYGI